MASNSEASIMEEREELMLPPRSTKHQQPSRRLARFLRPSVTAVFPNPPTVAPVPQLSSFKVSFSGWSNPQKNWKLWLDRMHRLHQSTWKQAGIYDAVVNSRHEIVKNDDLIISIAKKWCDDTKSFVFEWGEASITLEDMMVVGGYSVLGESVVNPIENMELQSILYKLYEARKEIQRSRANKAGQGKWLTKFKDSGSEIEHDAFLVLWLSRFVFPSSATTVAQNVFPIAVQLARGTRIALAPAVLASLYADLTFLKAAFVDSNNNHQRPIKVWAPFQLLQIWICERSPKLREAVGNTGKPTFERWGSFKNLHVDNLGSLLDCSIENFCLQPYDHKIYQEEGRWVVVGDGDGNNGLDEEVESWIRCVRVSELVGLGGIQIEPYLPHRVAMQFGLDQDVPGDVVRTTTSPETAWRFYSRPLSKGRVYLPSKSSKPYVSARYLDWWMQARYANKPDESTSKGSEEPMGGTRICDEARNVGSGEGESDDVWLEEMDKKGWELEARIIKLEEIFGELKGKKDGER